MKLELNTNESNALKALLVTLMANQVNTNAQSILTNSQNCIHFIGMIEKSEKLGVPEIKESLQAED